MLQCFYPRKIEESTYVIPFEKYVERGIRGVIFDIDNTLVPHGAPADERAIKYGHHIHYNSKNRRGSPRAFNTDGRTVREIRGRENKMAKTSMKIKQQRTPKFSTRAYNRCKICGRPHAYLRKYGICRICFRELAYKGQIPGVKKASW